MNNGEIQWEAKSKEWHWIAGAFAVLGVVGLLALIPPKPGTPMPGIGRVDEASELTLAMYDGGRGEEMLVPKGFRNAFVETLQSTGRYQDIRKLASESYAVFELEGAEYSLYVTFILEGGDDQRRGRGWEFDWWDRGQIALGGAPWTGSREDWAVLFESYETEESH